MTTAESFPQASLEPKSPFIRLATMMFLQFFIWGAWYVTMGPYMGAVGLGDSIGHAYTVGPIAAILSSLFLGMIADRFFASQKVLGLLHILGGLALAAAPSLAKMSVDAAAAHPLADGAEKPFLNMHHLPYLGALLVHMLCYMPTLGLTNSISFAHIKHPEKEFPVIRVLGTIGWIVAGFAVGYAVQYLVPATAAADSSADAIAAAAKATEAARASSPLFFYIAGASAVLLGLFSFALPHTPPPAAGKQVRIGELLGGDALSLLKSPSFAVFALCSLLICAPLAGYYSFAATFAGASGIKNVPVTMTFGQMSEIVFMLLMPAFFARLGVKWMLLVGMLAWAVRYALFATAAPTSTQWMILAGIILHGICYDFFFVTGFIYVDKKAPKEIRAQAQTFLVLITQGLGLGLGAQAFGRLVGHFTDATTKTVDWKMVWTYPAIAAAAIMVIFFLGFWEKDRTNQRHG